MLIVIANHKGGVGKTTLSLNIATELMVDALIDLDEKQTITKLNSIRTNEELPITTTKDLQELICQDKIILADCGGYDGELIHKILALSDLVITPVSDDIVELIELPAFNSILEQINSITGREIPCYAIPTRIHPSTKNISSITNLIEKLSSIKLMRTIIRSRKDYSNAASYGSGVTELANTKHGAAAKEIRELVREIKLILDIQ